MSSKRQTRGNAIWTIAYKTDLVLGIIARVCQAHPDATK
jgi:hypothetical protein